MLFLPLCHHGPHPGKARVGNDTINTTRVYARRVS